MTALQPLTDNQVANRLDAYNAGGKLERDIRALWEDAGDIIESEVRDQFGDEAAATVRNRYTARVDADWIQAVAESGRRIFAEKTSVPVYIAERDKLVDLQRRGDDPELQADIAHRIALMERASPDVVQVVAETLQRKASSVLQANDFAAVGGVQPLVEIINRADPGTEKVILEGLAARDEELAEEVRSRMFVFADITLLEDRAMQLVLRQVETAQLSVALKGVSDGVRETVMRNLSERARENLLEEIELLGPVRLSLVEDARAAIVQVIRRLEESGQIVIRRDAEDELVA